MKDSWVEIMASSIGNARKEAMRAFKNDWSMLYEEGEIKRDFFPKGCAGKLKGK